MANGENLKKGVLTQFRSGEEAARNGRKGGKASGAARRKKADFKKTLNMLLTLEIDNPEITPALDALGVDSTLESAINMAMIKEALCGNVKAYEAIAKYSGQMTAESEAKTEKIHEETARLKRENSPDDDNDQVMEFIKVMRNDNT